MTKRILFLGGAPSQIPPIQYAKSQGFYIITCDYLPNNPGHKLADEYHNISTTDQNAVLALAQNLKIDGIVAYASDPAAPTAAYVAEKLGLPGNTYKSVLTLARKDLFRNFLEKNNFNVPRSESFYDLEKAKKWASTAKFPLFVKPVDSSGSKGVTEIMNINQLEMAFHYGLIFSREKKIVIEEKIVKEGYQVGSDIFLFDGKLKFWSWGNQHHNIKCSQYVPVAMSYPSILAEKIQFKAATIIEEILKKLGCKSGAFNIEFLIDNSGDIWVLEIGPRNGGNLIPEVIKHATGVDLIKATVDSALGLNCDYIHQSKVEGYWAYYVVHSLVDGVYDHMHFSSRINSIIREKKIFVKKGDKINKYNGSNNALGILILEFPDIQTMLETLDNMDRDIYVCTI